MAEQQVFISAVGENNESCLVTTVTRAFGWQASSDTLPAVRGVAAFQGLMVLDPSTQSIFYYHAGDIKTATESFYIMELSQFPPNYLVMAAV
jgi:hypothetical protein